MKLPPSPPELIELFDRLAPLGPDITRRKMFGYPSVFVNGNLTAGLHANHFIFRLDKDDRDTFLKLPGATQFEPMAGRPMKEYVVAPEQMHADREQLSQWLKKSVRYARSLPAKSKR